MKTLHIRTGTREELIDITEALRKAVREYGWRAAR